MKVIVHSPLEESNRKNLAQQIASIHAQAIWDYIDKSSYLKNEKLKLFRQISDIASKDLAR